MDVLDKVMDTYPWVTIDKTIDRMIDKVILEMNPQILDDELNDVLDDGDNRLDAINYLIEKLQKIKRDNYE